VLDISNAKNRAFSYDFLPKLQLLTDLKTLNAAFMTMNDEILQMLSSSHKKLKASIYLTSKDKKYS